MHLSNQLPKGSKQSIDILLLKDISNFHKVDYSSPEEILLFSEREDAFRDKLHSYGLDELREAVIIYKLVFSLSFLDIAEHLGIPNRQTAFYLFKTALKILKERGYK